jgi:hypothetical protein
MFQHDSISTVDTCIQNAGVSYESSLCYNKQHRNKKTTDLSQVTDKLYHTLFYRLEGFELTL